MTIKSYFPRVNGHTIDLYFTQAEGRYISRDGQWHISRTHDGWEAWTGGRRVLTGNSLRETADAVAHMVTRYDYDPPLNSRCAVCGARRDATQMWGTYWWHTTCRATTDPYWKRCDDNGYHRPADVQAEGAQ